MKRNLNFFRLKLISLATLALIILNISCTTKQLPYIENKTSWHDTGIWLMGDTHMHTTTSDGKNTMQELARKATYFGCDFIAITNHHGPEKQSALDSARAENPSLIIFQGVEWRVPCDRRPGWPEATLFVTNHPEETEIINEFLARFDGYSRSHSEAVAGLNWLEDKELNGVKPVCIINHPSKNPDTYSLDHLRDYDDAGTVCIGISGAPGHQRNPYGKNPDGLMEGNDIMTARIGDYTDQLLNEGRNWWIRGPSDYHNEDGRDYWPGDYSENYVYCKSKSPEDIIEGYRSGCMYYCHGDIIEGLDFTVESHGVVAFMGEKLNLNGNKKATIKARIKYGPGIEMNHIEFISNHTGDPASLKIFKEAEWRDIEGWLEMSFDLTITRDTYIRIRGESSVPADKWFYSNPVRITGAGV